MIGTICSSDRGGQALLKRILFVDDDPLIIECYADIFPLLGYDTLTAGVPHRQ
jgi:hypothetical protein